jgi:hypothetical protein
MKKGFFSYAYQYFPAKSGYPRIFILMDVDINPSRLDLILKDRTTTGKCRLYKKKSPNSTIKIYSGLQESLPRLWPLIKLSP